MTNVLTLPEVADYLRVHPSTIYRLLKQQRIPAFKMGSDWRFNQESIDLWRIGARANQTARKRFPAAARQESRARALKGSDRDDGRLHKTSSGNSANDFRNEFRSRLPSLAPNLDGRLR
jgi:excisionase family DNA binding protein